MKSLLAVGFGGFLGSAARYAIGIAFAKTTISQFYLGTLSVNLIGCFLIGIFYGYTSKWNNDLMLFLMVGICGGFTTFSSFSLDGLKLLKYKMHADFLIYTSTSMIGGLLLCILGYYLTNR